MWWEFHRLMDLTPEQLVDEDDPIGLLEPVGPVDDERKGKQTWRYRFPRPGLRPRARRGLRPGARSRRARTTTRSSGPSATSSRSTPPSGPSTSGAPSTEPHPRAIVPARLGPDEGTTRTRLFELGELGRRPRDRGDRAAPRRPRPAVPAAAAGRPVARRAAAPRPARPDLEAARRLALVARPHDPRRSRAAGLGQDLHRRPDDRARCWPPASGSASRHEPQGHRQPPQGGPRGRRRSRASPSGRSRRATPDQVLDDPRVTRGKDATRRPGAARRRPGEPRRRDVLAVGVAEDGRRGRRPVRRRGRADLARQRGRDRPRDGQPRPARRPAAARPAAPGHRTRRAPTGRRWRTSSATRRRCRRPRACSSRRPGGSIRTCAPSPRRCSTTTGSSREPHLDGQRSTPPDRSSTAPARGCSTSRRSGADNESPGEADAVAALARAHRRGRVDAGSIDDGRRSRPIGWDDVLIVAPYNAQVGAIRRRLPPEARVGTVDKFQGQEAPISIYSMTTSSPGARAARDGLPVQPPPAQRRDVAGAVRRDRRRARPTCSRVRARTPDQMRLANAFCRFVELAVAPTEPATTPDRADASRS